MSAIKYPTGVINPNDRPAMKDYKVKPVKTVNHHHVRHGHNKYNAKGIWIDGYKFSSKVEGAFYLFMKRHSKHFSMQTRFYYRRNDTYNSVIDGKTRKLSDRSYRPDFITYDSTVGKIPKNVMWPKNPVVKHITAVYDVKGKPHMTPTASMRMDGFTDVYHIPVIIVRLDRASYTFQEYIKGYRKHKKIISLLK